MRFIRNIGIEHVIAAVLLVGMIGDEVRAYEWANGIPEPVSGVICAYDPNLGGVYDLSWDAYTFKPDDWITFDEGVTRKDPHPGGPANFYHVMNVGDDEQLYHLEPPQGSTGTNVDNLEGVGHLTLAVIARTTRYSGSGRESAPAKVKCLAPTVYRVPAFPIGSRLRIFNETDQEQRAAWTAFSRDGRRVGGGQHFLPPKGFVTSRPPLPSLAMLDVKGVGISVSAIPPPGSAIQEMPAWSRETWRSWEKDWLSTDGFIYRVSYYPRAARLLLTNPKGDTDAHVDWILCNSQNGRILGSDGRTVVPRSGYAHAEVLKEKQEEAVLFLWGDFHLPVPYLRTASGFTILPVEQVAHFLTC